MESNNGVCTAILFKVSGTDGHSQKYNVVHWENEAEAVSGTESNQLHWFQPYQLHGSDGGPHLLTLRALLDNCSFLNGFYWAFQSRYGVLDFIFNKYIFLHASTPSFSQELVGKNVKNILIFLGIKMMQKISLSALLDFFFFISQHKWHKVLQE